MTLVYLGSGPFGLPALRMLHGSTHRPALVVTRPDRPAGRGRHSAPTPVAALAEELGLPCQRPASVNDPAFLEVLRARAPDIIIVCDHGEILRQPFLDVPRIGAFNLHGSLLPRHRGAAPVVAAILAGDPESGVTLFRIERGLDTGPVVDLAAVPLAPLDTAGELEERLSLLAADLLERNLARLAAGSFPLEPQDETRATLAPKLPAGVGAVDWRRPAVEVARFIRALSPRPGAYSFLARGAAGTVERVRFLRAREAEGPPPPGFPPPGAVSRVEKHGFRVAAGDREVEVLELQPESRSPLSASEFLRGRRLDPGDRFLREDEE